MRIGRIWIHESDVPTNLGGMWLGAGGNVGIGTTNPSAKLQVGGNNETAPQYLWIRGNRVNETGDISGIHFYNSATSEIGVIQELLIHGEQIIMVQI